MHSLGCLIVLLPILSSLGHFSSQAEITMTSFSQSTQHPPERHAVKSHRSRLINRDGVKRSRSHVLVEHRKRSEGSRKTVKRTREASDARADETMSEESNPPIVEGLAANKSRANAHSNENGRLTNGSIASNNLGGLVGILRADGAFKSPSEMVCFLNGDQLDWLQILDFIATRRANSTTRPGQRDRPSNYYTGKGQPNLVYPKYHKFYTHPDSYEEANYNSNNQRNNNKATSYWLVPPFLIGALSICFAYVAIHCIYNHCHCGDKRSTSSVPLSPPHRRPLPNGIDHRHSHKSKKRVRRVHLVNAYMPPNTSQLRDGVQLRPGQQLQEVNGAETTDASEAQTTNQSIVSSNKNNTTTTTTSARPDLMPVIIFNNNNNNNDQADGPQGSNIKPHMQLQQLNSSPAYGISTSAFAYEDAFSNNNNMQRRYSHLVPIINYQQSSPVSDNQASGDSNQYFESRPFLLVEDGNDNDNDDDDDDYTDEDDVADEQMSDRDRKRLNIPEKQPRRKSALLKISDAIGRRLSQTRLSFSSIGTFSHQNKDDESSQMAQQKPVKRDQQPRASLCFFPVARTVSDPSCGAMQVVLPPTSPIFLDPLLNPNISVASLGHHDKIQQLQQTTYEQQLYMFQQQQKQQPAVNVPFVVVTGASDSSLNEIATRSLENHSPETTTTTTTSVSTSRNTSFVPTTFISSCPTSINQTTSVSQSTSPTPLSPTTTTVASPDS